MLEIFVLSSMANGLFWYFSEVDWWYFSASLALLSLTKYDYDTYMSSTQIKQGILNMESTNCCNLTYFNNPKSIKSITLNLRLLTGLLSVVALLATYLSKDNITDNIDWICLYWSIVCLFWFVAIIPSLVSLLQCAAAKTTPAIIKYRSIMTVYILHDIFLGGFWLYLSIMLYDLVDDHDDTEWRKIFISMLWWHLIIISCLAVRNIPKKSKIKTCCDINTLGAWQDFFFLFSIFCIYLVIIQRMQSQALQAMGSGFFSLFLFEVSLIVVYFCKTKPTQTKGIGAKDHRQKKSMFFNENYSSALSF